MKHGSLTSKVGSIRNWNSNSPRNQQFDVISKMSKMSVRTDATLKTSETSSQTTPKSARLMYLNSLMGRALTVLRPHPRNMVESLKQLADEVECIPSIKKALMTHVKQIEKLVMSNRKAGAMMNKTMMHWRMLLKPKNVDEAEIMRMIDDVEMKMAKIRHQLDLGVGKIADDLLPTRLYQCYLDDGMRIILFDSNDNIKDYVQSAVKMRKRLRSLQRKVNMSEYFENVKEWVMDAAVTCYVIMAIDTVYLRYSKGFGPLCVSLFFYAKGSDKAIGCPYCYMEVTALKLHPLIKDLAKNVKDGSVIETQFVNRLRTFNVCLHRVFAEAKMRRCQTLCPLDDMLAKMSGLDNMVANRKDPDDEQDIREFLFKLKRIDAGVEDKCEMDLAREKAQKTKVCDPVVLRNRNKKLVPEDLYPPFV